MALIEIGTADSTTLGNPSTGNYFLFLDSSNGNILTRRDSSGNDTIFGTGEGIDALGWVAITDTTYTSGSPQAITSGVDTQLDFNIDSFIETYAPNSYKVTDFFDATNNRINSPVLGAAYIFRLTFSCVPSNNTRVLDISYSIGTGVGSQIVIDSRETSLRTAGTATQVSLSSLIYSLSTFQTNGMEIILNATTNADIYDISMVLSRIN